MQSTAVDRTLQSGYSELMGLFPPGESGAEHLTKGEADSLRKAMGKKKKDIIDKMKPDFLERGKANGHDAERLEKIWTDWEAFASYAFNKSHSTCYAWVAYQTAYLNVAYTSTLGLLMLT